MIRNCLAILFLLLSLPIWCQSNLGIEFHVSEEIKDVILNHQFHHAKRLKIEFEDSEGNVHTMKIKFKTDSTFIFKSKKHKTENVIRGNEILNINGYRIRLATQKLPENQVLVSTKENGQTKNSLYYVTGSDSVLFSVQTEKVDTLVLSTTNGTRALAMASDAPTVVVGSLLNLDVLCKWLEEQNKNTLCLCSGWQDKFNLEDTICAGAISDYLLGTGKFTSDEDSSIAAKYLYISAWDNPLGYLKSSSHRRRLKNLNLNEDIKYCLTPNTSKVIPILKDGKLVKI
ncbi:2-phosphosulfolactate phosphatase [Crocinitomicaceae bacterium]|nr:2-phosphosulfolactate phosphatase [Crocinitomicaceae bacterium]